MNSSKSLEEKRRKSSKDVCRKSSKELGKSMPEKHQEFRPECMEQVAEN